MAHPPPGGADLFYSESQTRTGRGQRERFGLILAGGPHGASAAGQADIFYSKSPTRIGRSQRERFSLILAGGPHGASARHS